MKIPFQEFDDTKSLMYSAVFMLGTTQYFKENTLRKIKKNFSAINMRILEKMDRDFLTISYKPLFKGKWLLDIDFDNLKEREVSMLMAYLKKPSKYALLIIRSKNYKSRANILKNKFLMNEEEIAVLDYEYPPSAFIKGYIKDFLRPKVIKQAEISLICNRLAKNYDMYEMYLNLLKSIPDGTITPAIVRTVVDDLSTYGTDKLIETVIMLNKKTIPIRALNEVLSEKKPSEVMGMLRSSFGYITEAKHYEINGLLTPNGNINEDKKYIKVPKGRKSLVNLPNKYINRYLILAEGVTMQELAYINMLMSKFRAVRNSTQGEADLYRLVLALLGRRKSELTIEQRLQLI